MAEAVKVVFRKDNEGVIFALMPYDKADHQGHCTSYQHVGQHGAADYRACVHASKPATPEEYGPLLKELEGRGYVVQVIKRIGTRVK